MAEFCQIQLYLLKFFSNRIAKITCKLLAQLMTAFRRASTLFWYPLPLWRKEHLEAHVAGHTSPFTNSDHHGSALCYHVRKLGLSPMHKTLQICKHFMQRVPCISVNAPQDARAVEKPQHLVESRTIVYVEQNTDRTHPAGRP